MSIDTTAEPAVELCDGATMTRQEFHTAYLAYPEHVKFELINGIAHMASPATYVHGDGDLYLSTALGIYMSQTPGTHAISNATVELGDDDEPQPDLLLRIDAEFGGRSTRTSDLYIAGPPEFVIEISYSSLRLDLTQKREAYARNGILEYLVFDVRGDRFHWFDLAAGEDLPAPPDNVFRIRQFPGLWVDGQAVIHGDLAKAISTVHAGLASPEHAAFVAELAARRTPPRT